MFVRFFLVFFILFISTAQADVFSEEVHLSESLLKRDYPDRYYSVAKNKNNVAMFQLKITKSLSGILIRNWPNGKKQRYDLKQGELIDHLLVFKRITVGHNNEVYEIQALVDGHKEGPVKHLAASIYLYKDGVPKGENNTERVIFVSKPPAK